MFAIDYMSAPPITVQDSDPLTTARDLLHKHACHQLPVLDEAGRLCGIVTDRDIRSALGFDSRVPEPLAVSEVMTTNVQTIALQASLDEVVATLCDCGFNALPVVNHDKLVGIITVHDVLRAFHHLIGLDKNTHRVEIALSAVAPDLVQVFQSLRHQGEHLVSALFCSTRRDGSEPTLSLRVAGSARLAVEEALHKAGVVVLSAEHVG